MRLLRDAVENHPVWLEGIENARHSIDSDTYLLHGDACGGHS